LSADVKQDIKSRKTGIKNCLRQVKTAFSHLFTGTAVIGYTPRKKFFPLFLLIL